MSNLAVTGIYFFDKYAYKNAKLLKPSKRKETEIVDLIKIYLKKNNLNFKTINNTEWSDVGTIDDFNKISNFIKLKEISPKLYSKSQDNRNKFFFALTKDLFEEEVKDAYLGSTTFKIVFKNSEFKPKSSEIRELQNKIHGALKKYG